MAKDRLIVDKTEIIATVLMGNQWRNVPITADKIRRIQYDKFNERKIFKEVPSEMIKIETSAGPPVTFTKLKEKEYFDQYKERLAKFAKDNKLTFVDNTKE